MVYKDIEEKRAYDRIYQSARWYGDPAHRARRKGLSGFQADIYRLLDPILREYGLELRRSR
jgi:hypothetical protein